MKKCDGPHVGAHVGGKPRPDARFVLQVLDNGNPNTSYYYCQECMENQEYWEIVDAAPDG